MANHKSTLRRIRSDKPKALNNKYYHKTMRNALRDVRSEEDKATALAAVPKLVAQIDKLAKRGTIHKNKAANLKSKLAKKIASL
ncbi:MAG: 30S ribosomal protein S20 [Flavobacteriales bacterium]|jgi:small subunit ribosomal protein S20|nr:30S ribosomal protein S20 [Flavobacteriales bacterium]